MAKDSPKITKPRRGDVLIEVTPETAILQRKQQVWVCQCSKWVWKRHEIAGRIILRKECVEYADCELITIEVRDS